MKAIDLRKEVLGSYYDALNDIEIKMINYMKSSYNYDYEIMVAAACRIIAANRKYIIMFLTLNMMTIDSDCELILRQHGISLHADGLPYRNYTTSNIVRDIFYQSSTVSIIDTVVNEWYAERGQKMVYKYSAKYIPSEGRLHLYELSYKPIPMPMDSSVDYVEYSSSGNESSVYLYTTKLLNAGEFEVFKHYSRKLSDSLRRLMGANCKKYGYHYLYSRPDSVIFRMNGDHDVSMKSSDYDDPIESLINYKTRRQDSYNSIKGYSRGLLMLIQ